MKQHERWQAYHTVSAYLHLILPSPPCQMTSTSHNECLPPHNTTITMTVSLWQFVYTKALDPSHTDSLVSLEAAVTSAAYTCCYNSIHLIKSVPMPPDINSMKFRRRFSKTQHIFLVTVKFIITDIYYTGCYYWVELLGVPS